MPESPAAPAPSVPGVVLLGPIGAGGSAEVWAGQRGGEPVAVKIALGVGEAFLERFAREADALGRVGAPHAPRLLGSGRTGEGRPFLVMERLDGRSVAAVLEAQDGAMLALPDVHAIARAALVGLAAVHRAGLVHRDLKPDNLFLRPDRTIAVLDFGLARAAGPDDDARAVVAGSSLYLAPEQLRGDPIDPRTDLYAFGAVLYRLLTLRAPFGGGPAAVEHGHLALRPDRPGRLRAMPAAVEELVLACLAKSPGRRPASADEALARLDAAFDAADGAAPWATARAGAAAGEPAGDRAPIREERAVVLAWVETGGSSAAVSAAVERRGGWVVRQRGPAYLAAFAGDLADPARAAHAAAAQIVADEGGRAAIHAAVVGSTPRAGRPPRLSGDAIERPETWLPAGEWSGVAVGPELAGGLGADDRDGPLVGRDEVAAALAASARRALTARAPVLCTLVAGRGQGKSRLLRVGAERAAAGGASVSRIHAEGTGGDAATLARALGGADPARLGEAMLARAAAEPHAVVVDDAHRADEALLDALELAALGATGALWIAVATPSLDELRPRWGRRVERHDLVAVPPLAPDAAGQLAALLLEPAEYPPAEAVARLAAWAGHNPSDLTELCRALRRGGLVRPRAGAEGHRLATELIDALPSSPLIDWLGGRELADLPTEVIAWARLAAALGPVVDPAEIEAVQELAERAGDLSSSVDAAVGLGELAAAGLLVRDGAHHRFRSELVRESIHRGLPAPERARLHGHALAYWRGRPDGLERVARHAEAASEPDQAASAHLALAAGARAAHRQLDAERHATGALALLDDGDPRRVTALGVRGGARYRIDRAPEGLDDLARARELAAAAGDAGAEADLLLEEATALDWMERAAASRERVLAAAPLVERTGDPALAVRLQVALGRTAWREGRAADAAALLEPAADAAASLGDDESRVIALLLLAPIRVGAGRSDDAAAALDEVLARCERSGDRLHRQAALFNRCFLALARHSIDGAIADLGRVVDLAREDGHPTNERKACFNLAELRFWSGDDDGALELTRRTRFLEERFEGGAAPRTRLLAARIRASRGELDEVRRELAGLRGRGHDEWSEAERLLARALELVADPEPDAAGWDALATAARHLSPEEQLEILYWEARARPDRRVAALERAAPLRAGWPFLDARFDQPSQM